MNNEEIINEFLEDFQDTTDKRAYLNDMLDLARQEERERSNRKEIRKELIKIAIGLLQAQYNKEYNMSVAEGIKKAIDTLKLMDE